MLFITSYCSFWVNSSGVSTIGDWQPFRSEYGYEIYYKYIWWNCKAVISSEPQGRRKYILLYSYFEKGCLKKCMRQSWKVLWVVLSALFFKEIWKNGTGGHHRHMFASAKGKQHWSYPILPFRLLHAHFLRQPFMKKLYTSLFASFLQQGKCRWENFKILHPCFLHFNPFFTNFHPK